MSERLAVIGDPIEHSLSPAMHGAALRAAGIDAQYEARRVLPVALAVEVATLRAEGYRGFNVTIPHKVSIGAMLDAVVPQARALGAVNTVVRDGEHLVGYNTDPAGFLAALDGLVARAERAFPAHAVVLGAGGAARAVVWALASRNCRITVAARRREAAGELAGLAPARAVGAQLSSAQVQQALAGTGLIVNATPLGMPPWEDHTPLQRDWEPARGTLVMDLVYGYETPLLRAARAAGCPSSDGLEMLVQQGAEAFRLWFGVDPDLAVMRAACRRPTREMSAC